jgi:D-serine deaminase-like pyridoxal phosphate-dependent protein
MVDFSVPTSSIEHLDTPCLLLDQRRMEHNVARLRQRLASLGVPLRPHLKTAKSIDVARRVMHGPTGPAMVSTLKEAEAFADYGLRDLLYAVGITPSKLDRVAAIRARGIDLSVIVDNPTAARAVAEKARATRDRIPVLIEIDSDGHRCGVLPSEERLLVEIGRALHEGGAELRGITTHAGESYACRSIAALEAIAEQERSAAVQCAIVLRDAGLPSPVVSVGSTPTAHFSRDLSGITEVHAGVFMFFDLVMAGLGVCTTDEIALSVLATVIGHRPEKEAIFVDAGWMALSRDRGTADHALDQGYGLVCDLDGRPYPDLLMVAANQEHGQLGIRPGSDAPLPDLQIGDLVRILPNHACATGAQYDRYHVLADDSRSVRAVWPRFRGW